MKNRFLFILLLGLFTYRVQAQSPCENGMAGEFPCNNVTLLAHLSPEDMWGNELNDIWGWTDPETGKEYALVGLTDGVAFVDITDPVNPVFVGKLLEHIPDHEHLASAHGVGLAGLKGVQKPRVCN